MTPLGWLPPSLNFCGGAGDQDENYIALLLDIIITERMGGRDNYVLQITYISRTTKYMYVRN